VDVGDAEPDNGEDEVDLDSDPVDDGGDEEWANALLKVSISFFLLFFIFV
jgi:hypothetical protein